MPVSASRPVRVRRDVGADAPGSPDPATTWLATGVAALRARPAHDPRSWGHLGDTLRRHAPHGDWLFLPWHRGWLARVESALRAAVVDAGGPPGWALPYWDPGRAGPEAAVPRAFRDPRRADGTTNPLHAPRAPGINDGARLRPRHTTAEAALALTDFTGPPGTSFGGGRVDPTRPGPWPGELERCPHHTVRTVVGGTMAGSPGDLDPLLCLHLANIDRLWERWRVRGQGRHLPRDPRWSAAVLHGLAEPDGPEVRVADVVDPPGGPDQRYDDALPLVTRALRARLDVTGRAPAPPPGPRRTLAAIDGVTLHGPTELSLPLDPRAAHRVTDVLDDPAGGGRILLSLDHVEAVGRPAVVYELHLRAGGGTGEDDYVGVVGLGEAGARALDEVFDVTGLLDVLRHRDHRLGDILTLTLVPAGALPPPGGRPTGVPPAPVTVTQISLRTT